MAPRVPSPKNKKLKFTPLGITSQNKFDLEQYLKSFLRETFLRNNVYKVAAMCTMSVATFFRGKSVCLPSDKGMIHMLYVCMCIRAYLCAISKSCLWWTMPKLNVGPNAWFWCIMVLYMCIMYVIHMTHVYMCIMYMIHMIHVYVCFSACIFMICLY